MKKLLSLILALVMVLSLTACGSNDAPGASGNAEGNSPSDEVYTVSMQFTFPEATAAPLEAILDEIEEASGGRLKFEVYYSFSMIGNADVVDALQDGTLDIAGLMPNEFSFFNLAGRMSAIPLQNFESHEAASEIYMSMLYSNEAMMAEFTDNDLILWAGSMCPGYQMFFADEVSKTDPSVFSGLTIMSDNPEMQSFIAAQGGAVAAAYPPDFYSNLSNGVAEGLVQHLNCVCAFGCAELAKTVINFGEGFYYTPLVYCISESFWNELPVDLQQLLAEYSDEFCAAAPANDRKDLDSNGPALEASGATVIELTEAQKAEWITDFEPILDGVLDTIAEANPAVYDAYDAMAEAIANYDAETFRVGTNNFGIEVDW